MKDDKSFYVVIALVFFFGALFMGVLNSSTEEDERKHWCIKNYALYSEVQSCIYKGPHSVKSEGVSP